MKTKRCTKCGEIKPLREFYKQKGGKHGVGSRCHPCHRKKMVRYYNEKKPKLSPTFNLRRRKQIARIIDIIITLLVLLAIGSFEIGVIVFFFLLWYWEI